MQHDSMFLRQSTSPNKLNADISLSYKNKFLYFFNNFFYNLKKEKLNCEIDFFQIKNLENIDKSFFKDSPSRFFSNFFWKSLPWTKLKEELGEINIFDTGCGSGSYAKKLQIFSNNIIDSYFGIDKFFNENWQKITEKNISFSKFNGFNFAKYIRDKTNFFMTQSALEHIDYDLDYFQQVRDFLQNQNKKFIQVHLFPSTSCLHIYLLHGFRQYSFGSINKIIDLYKMNNYHFKLFVLGGKNCNQLHFKYITLPMLFKLKDRRKIYFENYQKKLLKAIYKDQQYSDVKHASFFGLVITNINNIL